MGVLVHPQLGLRFGAALPGACFFAEKQHFVNVKKHAFQIFGKCCPDLVWVLKIALSMA